MKKSILSAVIAVVAIFGTSFSAQAQFKYGLQVGTNVNTLHFNKDLLSGENRMGFNVGAMVEFTVPVIGIGADLGVRYVRRNTRFEDANGSFKNDRDYIEIPLNLKYKLNIPVINNIIRPYLATGPSVSILTSKKAIKDFQNKKYDTAWNFGFGVELVKHVQIGASYGLGLTKAMKAFGTTNSAGINGKNRYWTITATYLF